MIRTKWSLIAVATLAAAAFATPPPAKAACSGHEANYSADAGPKFDQAKAQAAFHIETIAPATVTLSYAYDDPAAKVDKSALSDNICHGIGHISAINVVYDIGAGGSEVAATASEGVWPLTAGPKANTTIGHIAGTTSS